MTAHKTHSRILEETRELERPFVEREPQSVHGVPDAEPLDPLEQAYERGLNEGLERGRGDASALFEERCELLRKETADALRCLGELQVSLAEESVALLKQLALEAASRIVRAKIDEGDPVAVRALEEAIRSLPTGETLKARLHPDDLESVQRDLAEAIGENRIEVTGDETVTRGGCIVESAGGQINATLEAAIEQIDAAVDGQVGRP